MFRKMSVIEPIMLTGAHMERLKAYTQEIVIYRDIPADNAEIIRRIGDADCVMLRYTTKIDREVLEACPTVRYIGMCCSLYAPENANVDILTANKLGITVTGVRDYGDEGVPEYVISELVRFLHGFGGSPMWREQPAELTGIPVGVLGLGTSGALVAKALAFFGAEVSYYSRTRKPELEEGGGFRYRPLDELLQSVDILLCCLNKNAILLHDREFGLFGNGKILMNTSIGPAYDVPALAKWLENPANHAFSDLALSLDPEGILPEAPNVHIAGKSSGMTSLAVVRLGEKVIANIEGFFAKA
jgi:phosphoglycerate dehydrogenase-like enzyme